jgi:uracil phosphoribosyltransferase
MKTTGYVTLIRHPLIQQKLTVLRDKQTDVERFRQLLSEIAMLMVFQSTNDMPVRERIVETPIGLCRGVALSDRVTIVPILRAGLGMTDGIIRLIPEARIGHVGIRRNEETLQPTVYYTKLPQDIADSEVIMVDPMLATGGSIAKAVDVVKERGAKRIRLLCLVAAPEGIEQVHSIHSDLPIYTAAIDERLDERGYIVPGLGDAGDRVFGTL